MFPEKSGSSLKNKNRLSLLVNEIEERGLFHLMKRLTAFIVRPLADFEKQNSLLRELFHGYLSRIKFYTPFYSSRLGLIKFPQTELVEKVRQFWYSNTPGKFSLDGENISRRDILVYGGPNPKFSCLVCQKAEWLSRVRQKNMFVPHACNQSEECAALCQKQGNELWAHLHQNFDFSIGCDETLPAAKGIICYGPTGKKHFLEPGCDNFLLLLKRSLSYSCQVDVTDNPFSVDWSKYDFAWVGNMREIPKFKRPNLPVILYGHDFWGPESKLFQWVIDWLEPDVLMSTCPGPWEDNFKLPKKTRTVLRPFFESTFFARPNLDRKEMDLLIIGAISSPLLYQPRITLTEQLKELPKKYKVKFHQLAGAYSVYSPGGVVKKDTKTGLETGFLNKWSEYLSRAKYVIFGGMRYPVLVSKYYETLGSGAIPIFPEIPDLKRLGIKAFEHYIPLSEVEGNNQKLAHFLDNYEKYRHIAENAVNWYKENSDKMLFNDFEDLIREITSYKYPKRLI